MPLALAVSLITEDQCANKRAFRYFVTASVANISVFHFKVTSTFISSFSNIVLFGSGCAGDSCALSPIT